MSYFKSLSLILPFDTQSLVPYFVADTVPSVKDTFSRHHLQLDCHVILDA